MFWYQGNGKSLIEVYATVDGKLDHNLWFTSVSAASNFGSVAAGQTSSTNGNIWWTKRGGLVGLSILFYT